MKFLGNIIWFIFGGLFTAIEWFIVGLLLSITVIGIPFGLQCFKIACLVLWPFGKKVDLGNFGVGGLLLNVLWILLAGWILALTHITIGFLFCITIVGIPFGLQHFKFARLSFLPFGAKIS
ncbi:YccF domain-containing protein [bacterium AH-315-E09]|nr:YccF domain-containing protein [Alkaliphilus sp. AH-315-G20]MBN4074770.1 YccF domain-containing protein [bacterium AH-315-E09]